MNIQEKQHLQSPAFCRHKKSNNYKYCQDKMAKLQLPTHKKEKNW